MLATVVWLIATPHLEAQTPPVPPPGMWIEAGGSIGEDAVAASGAFVAGTPYQLAASLGSVGFGVTARLVPPLAVIGSGTVGPSRVATARVAIPNLASLVGTKVHLQSVSFSRIGYQFSEVAVWHIAPRGAREFTRVAWRPQSHSGDATRTRFQNGRLLFSGGSFWTGQRPNPLTPLAQAHTFNPADGTYVRVGDLNEGRHQHRAIGLPDGTVLVVGGDFLSATPTAELYDPTIRSFVSLGPVPYYVSEPVLTLVRDPGTNADYVLVSGGLDANALASSDAMLYDVSRRTFVRLPSLPRPRRLHTAAALPSGAVLLTGGWSAGLAPTNAVDLFHLPTRQFHAWGQTRRPRVGHSVFPLDQRHVLLVGGTDGQRTRWRTLTIFDALQRTSVDLPVRSSLRWISSAVRLNDGTVLATDGQTPEIISLTSATLLKPFRDAGGVDLLGTGTDGRHYALPSSKGVFLHRLR